MTRSDGDSPAGLSDRWPRVKDVFLAATRRDAAERDAFLEAECANDPALMDGVRRLLNAHDEARSFMRDSPPGGGDEGAPAFSDGQLVADRYLIVRFIGGGGMAEVYEAEDSELRQRVALKIVQPSIANDPVAIERFRREIALARMITHPNVCRVFDLGRHRIRPADEGPSDVLFLTMELLRGETLATRIETKGPMKPEEALPIATQLAEGLAAAHKEGVVHRDLKSSNIMLVPSSDRAGGYRAVITDFGLARGDMGRRSEATLTGEGHVIGTPAYMSPEQVEGGVAGVPSDIYSLGLVLYEMVTGVHPFDADSPLSMAVMRLKHRPASPRLHSPLLDRRWETVIMRCLETEPGDRFSSATEVLMALSGGAVMPSPRRRRRRRLTILVALLVISGAGGVVFLTMRGRVPAGRGIAAPVAGSAELAERRGDYNEAQRLYREALGAKRETGDESSVVELSISLARVADAMGNLEEAKQMYQQALALNRRVGNKAGAAFNLGKLADVQIRQGELAEGRQASEEALAACRELDDRSGAALALGTLGTALLKQANLAAAEKCQLEALELARAARAKSAIAAALHLGAEISYWSGNLTRAREWHLQALALREALGDTRAVAQSRLALAETIVAERRWTDAEPHARTAINAFRAANIEDQEGLAQAVLAAALLGQQRTDEAQRAMARATRLVIHTQVVESRMKAAIVAARLLESRGKHPEALRNLEWTLAQAQKTGMICLQLEARLARGEIEMTLPSTEGEARAQLERVAKEAEEIGMRLVAQRAREALMAALDLAQPAFAPSTDR